MGLAKEDSQNQDRFSRSLACHLIQEYKRVQVEVWGEQRIAWKTSLERAGGVL